ncbi:GNAT family N-acetyltransferase [Streptomyces luteoverticillatus]|uniref:GNAT family N-acetyltransferase n=1 Tax=Streptomyces luteoverticillatus TaxID=66425 RepID=A0A3Q9FZ25_STRLT|nr:GNAT family N-acetyltransferase [Streptomyces luteoverticillatus]
MYVIPEARGRGLARRMPATLEDNARASDRTRMVLETGINLTAAVSLYVSSGYEPCAKFGHYRFDELSRCYAKPLAAVITGPWTAWMCASRAFAHRAQVPHAQAAPGR